MVITPDQRFQAALEQAGRFFMGTSNVQLAAERLVAKLDELAIPYAICGGLAVFAHGHERMTKDVDVLLTADGLRRFREAALGLGWLERFPGSRHVRDTVQNVPVDVLLAGGHPGDGVPRGVVFPDPERAGILLAKKRVLALPHLIELKIASGMHAPDRLQDFADVLALIRVQALPLAFGDGLHAEVQAKWQELWHLAQRPQHEP